MKMNPRWDVEEAKNCCSEQVEIIFSALRSTICEFGDKTLTWQGRNATSHIVETVRPMFTPVFLFCLFIRSILEGYCSPTDYF